jgi:hypothetical protein
MHACYCRRQRVRPGAARQATHGRIHGGVAERDEDQVGEECEVAVREEEYVARTERRAPEVKDLEREREEVVIVQDTWHRR